MEIKRVKFKGFFVKSDKFGTYFGTEVDFVNTLELRIFDAATKELLHVLSIEDNFLLGNILAIYISGLNMSDKCYQFNADGKVYVDKYSCSIIGNEKYGELVSKEDLYSFVLKDKEPKLFVDETPLKIPYNHAVFYEAHVRGLTMLDKTVPEKYRGTFEGISYKAKYLKELGVTSLILMPCYEFIEKEKLDTSDIISYYKERNPSPRLNYWGFKEGFYFAPKASYAYKGSPDYSVKEMISTYHKNNLEVLMFMYFPAYFEVDYILSILRYWVINYHFDGFRIIGENIPISSITEDPFLKDIKLIFDNVEYSSLHLSNGRFKNVGLVSDIFTNKARQFIKGDEDCVSAMSFFVRENGFTYSPLRNITDYRGFTLNDLVSYSRKHNESNNEDNLDGENYNYSWNCGEEGKTKKNSINSLRLKQARNAYLVTLLCQGAPLLLSGDEWLNTSFGNNNAYCQDNETGWVIYNKTARNKAFYEFTKNLLAFRKRHSILHQPKALTLTDYMSCGYPDISFHGEESFMINQNPYSRDFGVLLYGDYARQYTKETEDSIFIVYNMNWEDREISLPKTKGEQKIRLLYSTDGSTDESFDESKALVLMDTKYTIKARTVSVLLLDRTDRKV